MIEIELQGINLVFETNDELFSPSRIDKGTLAMISKADFQSEDKVLDLGCGYGIVGIYASKIIKSSNVIMCDISETAIALAKENLHLNSLSDIKIVHSDGLEAIEETDFTLILSNPPYHVDFSVPKRFIEQGFKKLAVGGRMLMVTKRKEWYKNKFCSIFGGVSIAEVDGYYVFTAIKRNHRIAKATKPLNENKLSKKLQRRHRK